MKKMMFNVKREWGLECYLLGFGCIQLMRPDQS